jgi:plastocyanin
MKRCSCCWPSRSERRPQRPPARHPHWSRPAFLAAALLPGLLPPLTSAAPAEGGTLRGTVRVERAALRTEGPKHDLDVVVSVEPVGTAPPPPATAREEMDQKGLVFLPHVLAVEKGTTVTFLNSDHEQHNVYFLDDRTGDTLDIGTWGPGVSVDHTFTEPGMVITLCKLHLEMAAYIVVLDGPWFTTVRLDPRTYAASFEIDDVPAGEVRLTAWHKKLRQKGGAAVVTVPAGGAATAEVVITPAKYAK